MVKKLISGNFLNNKNNRLKSLNQKVKSVVARYSILEDFCRQFLLLIDRLRMERHCGCANSDPGGGTTFPQGLPVG